MSINDQPMSEPTSSNSIIEFRTNQCRALKAMFDALKEHIVDISFLFSREGIKVMQISSTDTFLVTINLSASEFQHYYCREEKGSVELNVSLSNIHKVFKAVGTEDNLITWVYREDNEDVDVLSIFITSEKKNEERQYDIRLQEADEDIQEYSDVTGTADFPYNLTMPCVDLQHICRDLKNLNAKYVDITHDGTSLSFETKTDICNNCKITRRPGDVDAENSKNIKFHKTLDNGTFKDRFKFDLLHSFSKCAQTGSTGGGIVRILLNQDSPLILQFSIGTLGELGIALAPYGDDED